MTAKDTIKQIQTLLSVTPDGNFGPKSEAALKKVIAAAKKEKEQAVPGKYSAVFEAFFPFLMTWEGEVYEDDPNDPGGATKFGIDARSHPGIDIKNLTKEKAKAIYWKEWLEAGCDRMPSPYAEVFFNCAVNMGLSRAEEFSAKSNGDSDHFLTLQEQKYRSLGASPKRKIYLKGWLNRTTALRKRFGIA